MHHNKIKGTTWQLIILMSSLTEVKMRKRQDLPGLADLCENYQLPFSPGFYHVLVSATGSLEVGLNTTSESRWQTEKDVSL